MRLFNRSRANFTRLVINVRELHTFDAPRPEIVIGNNSALLATLASLEEHEKHVHPELSIVRPEHWLDKVIDEYYPCTWGQTPLGLPTFAREIFTRLYPKHDIDQLIELGQFIGMRSFIIDTLAESYGVPMIHGTPEISRLDDGGYELLVMEGENLNEKLLLDSNTYFYSWYREARKHSLPDNIIPNRSASLLYTQPRSEASEVLVILGAGLQTAWAERNFKNSRIICLCREEDSIPELPANKDVNYDRIEMVNLEDAEIAALGDSGLVEVKARELGSEVVMGEFYEGMGYTPVILFDESIPKESYEQLKEPHLNPRFFSTMNIPAGSLMESYVLWAHRTNNLSWAFEPFAYHEEGFPKLLTESAREAGIELPCEYFDTLERYLRTLSDPEPEALQLEKLVEIFKMVVASGDQISSKFKSILSELDKNKLRIIDNGGEEGDNTKGFKKF